MIKIILALLLILSVPVISMAFCPPGGCQSPCGGNGYYGCTEAEIVQIGSLNQADITQNGGSFSSNLATISQLGIANKASINQHIFADHNEASIAQTGMMNQANINQYGDTNDAFVTQNGFANHASVGQYSNKNLASTVQNGIGNSSSISQGTQLGGAYTATVNQSGWANSATVLQK